ncbi:MAG: tetratricopeptide repeat protein, partial [Verrucomicrobiota bacterium]|nr:tetratricopeptide repeat protein [Verrucomicrobiota bacterium]
MLSDESFAQDAQEPSKEKAEKKDPALDQYYVANAAFNRKLYPVAAGQFESFLEKHPKHPKADLASQGLALSLYALKQYDKAMPHLEGLLAKEEIDSTISRERLVMLLGQCLMISEKKSDAKNLFLKEIKIIKDKAYRVAALAAICDVSFNEQNWEEVESWADQLVSSKPSPEALARGLYQQGYAKYQLKKTNEAILSLSAIAQLEANKLWSTRANYLLGECYNILKDYAKAEVSFLAALPGLGKPESTECHYRLGVTRFILRKYTDSIENLSTYLKDQPEGKHAKEAAFYIARSNLENKEYEGSGESFAMLSQGDGQIAAQASLWQARVLTRSEKNYDKASEILSDALERFSDSNIVTDIRYDLANSLMGKKTPDWKRALALLIEVEKDEGFKQLAELT